MNLNKLVSEEAPRILPKGWKPIPLSPDHGIYRITPSGLKVIFSYSRLDDGRAYRHVSFSRDDKLPSWDEMRDFIYNQLAWMVKDEPVFMTLPPPSEYVNVHPFALHWWQEIKE